MVDTKRQMPLVGEADASNWIQNKAIENNPKIDIDGRSPESSADKYKNQIFAAFSG